MLKDILIKSAELLNRDDIINEINDPSQSENTSLKNDICRLISYFNYTVQFLCEKFFPIEMVDTISSDKNRKIYYNFFSAEPLNIISVEADDKLYNFSEHTTYITVPIQEKLFKIKYNFLPQPAKDIYSPYCIPAKINQKIIIYGIVSEFCASKNHYEESNYWHNKYMFEIYKSKTNSNKRMKATFTL